MTGILQLAKNRLLETANQSGIYVDFTMGKGRDTLFLSSLCPNGRVFSFDIQPSAIIATKELLAQNNVTNATLILDSHDNFLNYVSEQIDGGLFNLGFLPGGDRSITTRSGSTLSAVKLAMHSLKPKGAIGVAVYPGHEEGRLEGESLQRYFSTVDKKFYDIFIYRLLNVSNSPYMMIIERR